MMPVTNEEGQSTKAKGRGRLELKDGVRKGKMRMGKEKREGKNLGRVVKSRRDDRMRLMRGDRGGWKREEGRETHTGRIKGGTYWEEELRDERERKKEENGKGYIKRERERERERERLPLHHTYIYFFQLFPTPPHQIWTAYLL